MEVGRDVRDWCEVGSGQVDRGQIAWVGTNQTTLPSNRYVRLYLTTWKNPQPEKTVESIDYVATNGKAAPFCLAMTVEEPRPIAGGDR